MKDWIWPRLQDLIHNLAIAYAFTFVFRTFKQRSHPRHKFSCQAMIEFMMKNSINQSKERPEQHFLIFIEEESMEEKDFWAESLLRSSPIFLNLNDKYPALLR